MDKERPGVLFSLPNPDSSWLFRKCPSEDISVVEEIEEEIEEDIMEEFQEKEDIDEVQDHAEEPEEGVEEVQEQPSDSNSRENNSYSSSCEAEESERSEQSDGRHEALEVERRDTAALKEALKKVKHAKAQYKAALKQERKEKEALAKTLRNRQAEKDSLRVEVECLKSQVADLKKSQKDQQRSKAKLKDANSLLTAEIKEDMKLIEKLQKDLEASSCHHEREAAQRNMVSIAKIKALNDELIEQQEESLEKDDRILSLQLNIQELQCDVEAKDHIVSTLQEKVNRWASDEEQTKNCSPQRDYEAGVSQQLKEAEELDRLTHENQHLASENRWLQGELEAAQTESQLHQKQLQDDREACSRREENEKENDARFQMQEKENDARFQMQQKENNARFQMQEKENDARFQMQEKENDARFQMQEKELSEKTLALEKSVVGEKLLRSFLGSEKKRFDQMILKKQASVEPLTILRNQPRDASANSEHLMYDMKTLRMENADIRAKFHVMETEFDRTRSNHQSLSERHEELMSKQNDTISENQLTITKLQCAVDWLKAQQSESKTGRAELEDALKQYKATVSELQQIAPALEKERARGEKQRVKLKEALTRQTEILEEKQDVAVALQKAQDDVCRLQEQQLESNFQLRHISDAELRLNQQRTALDESTKALYHLQREYTDLGRRHSDINADYHELLKTHSALQIKYERLCYAQGNPRPDFSPPLFSQTVI